MQGRRPKADARLRALRALAGAGVLLGTALAAPAAAVVTGSTPSLAPVAAPASDGSAQARLHVDRAGYVAITPVDPYRDDHNAIHIAMAAGQALTRGYLHVDLRRPPAHAQLSTLRLSAPVVVGSPIGGARLTIAEPIVEACVLTAPLPATVTAASLPAYDCSKGSAVAKAVDGGAEWAFTMRPLLSYWTHHGNTGAALVPIASTPVATWSAALSIHDLVASVARAVVGTAVSITPSASPTAAARRSSAATGPAIVPPPVAQLVTPSQATVSPPALASPNPELAAATTDDHGVLDQWPWVLALCFLIAIGAIAIAHWTLVTDELRRQLPPVIAMARTHPRAYGVAAAAIAWGLVFTGYAVVNNNSTTTSSTVASVGQPGITNEPGGSTTPATPGGSTAPAATGSASAAESPGGAASQPGASPSVNPSATEFTGKGHWETISGTRVFFPANGGVPTADLYHGADDRIGITATSITLCAHAALTYGAAFDIGAKDLNVYWNWLNAHGGIFGRKVSMSYENDNYDPTQAVQAAQKCKDMNPFMLIGGIGFDQIPAVRQWAEQNKMLYLYHDAVYKGSQGLKYSFTALPSVEQLGQMFGELDLAKFAHLKVGILYRQSPNWQPGSDEFESVVKAGGGDIVAALPVQNNQANYVGDLVQLKSKGAQVVFAWENALATTEMIKQAQALAWHPSWLVFPFNLETDTLGQSSFSQPLWGVASWDAYDPFDHGGPFKPYAAEMTEFEKQYAEYDPGAHLSGDGGDLLYLNWAGQAFISYLLQKCGPDCTRNRLAGLLLAGFKYTKPPACPIDFDTGDHHHGGDTMNVFTVIRDPKNRPNWAPVKRCITSYK